MAIKMPLFHLSLSIQFNTVKTSNAIISYGYIHCHYLIKVYQGFDYTKEIPKNTKENIPAKHFGSHFSQKGPIDLISPPDCCIFNALSIYTHISKPCEYMAKLLYGQNSNIWPYSHMVI